MAIELRESFPILEDATSSNAGAALSLKAEGSAAASGGTNYAGMLVGKNAAGNLQFLKLTPTGELVVSLDGADFAFISDEGTLDNGIGTLTTLVTFALQASKVYDKFEWLVSCFRDVKYVVEGVEDVGVTDVITILGKGRCGPGQYDSHVSFQARAYTAGTTGTLAARIRALNTNSLSDIDGVLGAREAQ
jgi:hypothetical protein